MFTTVLRKFISTYCLYFFKYIFSSFPVTNTTENLGKGRKLNFPCSIFIGNKLIVAMRFLRIRHPTICPSSCQANERNRQKTAPTPAKIRFPRKKERIKQTPLARIIKIERTASIITQAPNTQVRK